MTNSERYQEQVKRLADALLALEPQVAVYGGNGPRSAARAAEDFGDGLPKAGEAIDKFLHAIIHTAIAETGAKIYDDATNLCSRNLEDIAGAFEEEAARIREEAA